MMKTYYEQIADGCTEWQVKRFIAGEKNGI
jgi:hypothetical protein